MSAAGFWMVALFGVLIPLLGALIWAKCGGKIIPMVFGALGFFAFANVLEGICHAICLGMDNSISRYLSSNPIAYGIYGALAAGIFEETGRFFIYKTFLSKFQDRKTAISYGLGHGGMEMVLVLTANYVVLALASAAIGTAQEAKYAQLLPALSAITPGLMGIAVMERICAMAFHLSASVFVFAAARNKRLIAYYPMAIVLHALLDFPAALYQAGMLGIWRVEGYVAGFTLVVSVYAWQLYKKLEP